MRSRIYRVTKEIVCIFSLFLTQTGGAGAFTYHHAGQHSAVGHLGEEGSSDGYDTAWTYARYYGGAFYGGGPDRKSLAYTEAWYNGGTYHFLQSYDNTQTAVTYVSTGSLFDSDDYEHAQSWVDTDVDISTDPNFNSAVGFLEALGVVSKYL